MQSVKPVNSDSTSIKDVELSKLHLDLKNPRLPETIKKTPKGVLTWIAKSTAIEDLMSAIATNGFFPGEPVVVCPHPSIKDDYVVIEGNRRLTACKLLWDPSECDKPSAAMITIAEAAAHKPKKLPVVVAQTRESVLPYLGFRHITGIKEWDPLAKAKYINQLFDLTNKKATVDARYQQVAQTIGSRRDHIKRNLDALAVYEVLENNDFFQIQGLGEESIKFAVLSTALADEKIGEFVGTAKRVGVDDDGRPIRKSTNPIANPGSLKSATIKELSQWLFEKKDGKTVIGESRKLRELAAVVDAPKALQALRAKSSLAYAYRLTSGANSDFLQHLYAAQGALDEATALVPNVGFDQEAYDLAKELSNSVKLIGKTLKDKQAGADDDF